MAEMIEKNSYIIKDAFPDRAYGLLAEKLSKGYDCLCVTRTNPSEIKGKYDLNAPVIWLTNQKNKDFSTTVNLNTVKGRIRDFIRSNKKSVVLLDRLDYLINVHGFNNVLKFIYSINDDILMSSSILMLNIDPNTLASQELSLLEQELKEIPKLKLHADSDLPDDLHEILVFVANNDKVTFKKVSKEFSITKTTTRKRINKLQDMNKVIIRKNGRNKIVRITEEGKKCL